MCITGADVIIVVDRYEAMYVDRLASMVERDKNHPSIIMWSLGTHTTAHTHMHHRTRT
jgi:beta-galactosidase/beta-glucuronidase